MDDQEQLEQRHKKNIERINAAFKRKYSSEEVAYTEAGAIVSTPRFDQYTGEKLVSSQEVTVTEMMEQEFELTEVIAEAQLEKDRIVGMKQAALKSEKKSIGG